MSRLLRRQVLRTFEHVLDLNRPSRPHVRPPALRAKRPLPPFSGQVGQGGLCGRLRLACGRNSLAIAAEGGDSSSSLPKGVPIRYQAGQRYWQRRPVRGFEPGIVFGMKVATKMNLFQTDSLPMFDCLCTHLYSVTSRQSVVLNRHPPFFPLRCPQSQRYVS